MHEHVGKRAKMQRSKEKPNGWHKASKASITTSHEAKKGYAASKPTPRRWISQVVTPKQSIRGANATTQASGLKD